MLLRIRTRKPILSVWPSHGSARDYAVLRNNSGSPHGLLKYYIRSWCKGTLWKRVTAAKQGHVIEKKRREILGLLSETTTMMMAAK